MTWRFFYGMVLSLVATVANAQVEPDTVKTFPADTLRTESGKKVVTIETYADRFNPRKAILYAAVLPGSGQIYNKKYWKVPLVYGGFATGIYFIDFYQDRYLKFKSELFNLLETGSETSESGYSESQLRNIIDDAKRERDFFSILTGFWYILQLVDAHVDAHLKEFDLNPQLQVSIEPMTETNPWIGRSTGLTLKFKF